MTPLAPLLDANPVVFAVFVSVFGLVVGSFLNVVIHRLPIMLDRTWRRQCDELIGKSTPAVAPYNLVVPRSQCPACGHRISALENIPVLSFLVLRGKCAGCGARISVRYPAVELAGGLMAGAVAWHFGVSAATAGGLLLTWALIALAVIDYDHQLLPDDITLPLLWIGLLFNLNGANGTYVPLASAVIGAIAGYMSLWLVYQLFRLLTGREGMGYGDFKLFAVFGAWLGWQQLPLIILLSSFVGAVVGLGAILLLGRDRRVPIPFGPFLCVSGWIALLWGDTITRAYLQFARVTG